MAPLMANGGRKFPAGVSGKPARSGRGSSLFSSCCYYLIVTLIGLGLAFYWLTTAGPALEPEEDMETELKGCPVCQKREIGRTPLDRALSDRGSKIRLCTGSELAPFVQGTLAVEIDEIEVGLEVGTTFAQLTIFEAEIVHTAPSDPAVLQTLIGTKKRHTSSVRLLVFLEDDDSIKRSQWEGWGAAEPSALYWKHLKLKCKFWPGHDTTIQSLPAAYEMDAVIEHYYSFHMVLTCPLPPYPSPYEGEVRKTLKDGRAYFVQFGQKFHIQLSAQLRNDTLRMGHIPLCRSEYEPALLQLDPTHIAPPVSSNIAKGLFKGLPEQGLDNLTLEGSKADGLTRSKSLQVGICLRPFHGRKLFNNEEAFADARLVEWIDAALILGVDRIYFYDRYATDKKVVLKPYIDRGQVIHIPFPAWSEVLFRKGQYGEQARVPYLFPKIYDQIISYEHCMMQGRRFGDRWQFHIDTDEFLWYEPRKGALLKPLLARIEANHTKTFGEPLKVMKLRRFNFFGVEAESRGEPVLGRLGWRCSQPMWHTEGWVGWHDKLAVNPQLILPYTVTIHNTNVPLGQVVQIPKEMFHINHYTSAGLDLGHHPCRPWVKPVKDEGLVWVALKLWRCKHLPCSRKIAPECWPFCQLPWPPAHEDHKGEPEEEVDLSAQLSTIYSPNGTNYPAEPASSNKTDEGGEVAQPGDAVLTDGQSGNSSEPASEEAPAVEHAEQVPESREGSGGSPPTAESGSTGEAASGR